MSCNMLAIIGVLIAALIILLAYTTGRIEGFATVAKGVPSMTQCQNLNTEAACNNDAACIWCKSRGRCDIKGQRTECIEEGDNGDIYQATATSSGLNLRPQAVAAAATVAATPAPSGTTPTPAAPRLAVSTPAPTAAPNPIPIGSPARLPGRR